MKPIIHRVSSLTFQQIYDACCRHMLRQRRRAYKDGSCKYRVYEKNNTLKCHVGIFISEEIYAPYFDNGNTTIVAIISRCGFQLQDNTIGFMRELQSCHDLSSTYKTYKMNMILLARKYNLRPFHFPLIQSYDGRFVGVRPSCR